MMHLQNKWYDHLGWVSSCWARQSSFTLLLFCLPSDNRRWIQSNPTHHALLFSSFTLFFSCEGGTRGEHTWCARQKIGDSPSLAKDGGRWQSRHRFRSAQAMGNAMPAGHKSAIHGNGTCGREALVQQGREFDGDASGCRERRLN